MTQAEERDKKRIEKLTEGLNLESPSDIKQIYDALKGGATYFETKVGRDFDDQIYELYEKVKKGEITEPKTSKKSKPIKEKAKKADVKKENTADKYGSKIDDLVAAELKKRDKKNRLMVILASLVAAASLGYFGYYYFNSNKSSNEFETLASLKGSDVLASNVNNDNEESFTLNKKSIKIPDVLEDYATLYAKNKRLAGWLKISGTNIDYPVMQTVDNEYYLNHNFNQEKDANGSLFVDCACSLYPRSANMIIYGHHMKSGNMFGNLQKYASEKYGKEHSVITFDTIYEKATYQVMYVFYSKVYDNDDLVFKYYQFIDANSETEFNYYMEEMKALSLYDTGVTAEFGDTLLTLSTCDNSQTDGRFAVVAKRIS